MSKIRTIDANALKQDLRQYFTDGVLDGVSARLAFNQILHDIDNAPTVEIPENAVNCVLTMFGKCSYNETGCSDCEIKDKIRKALNERPQGEWIIIEHETLYLMGIYQCNLCSYKYICPDEFAKNFCPNCGADMEGGDNK